MPARPGTLNRIVTNCSVALTQSLTRGTDHYGDIKTWNPALGDAVYPAVAYISAPTPAPRGHGEEQMAEANEPPEMVGWRIYVKYFTPSWYTVTMGTGIVAILLNLFPYPADWLYWLSVVVFVLNIVLFVFFTLVLLLRFALWPSTWKITLNTPQQAIFLGAIPTGLSTIINMMVFVCVPSWGEWVIYTAWGLWMVDAVLSLACALFLPFLLIHTADETPLSSITALQLFPVVAAVVASASAAAVANVLPGPEQALVTLMIGYVLWGLGVPAAMFILVVYFHRLTIHKLPPREVIVSCFLPLGPPSMGAFAIMKLGKVAMKVFPETQTIHPLAGDLAYNLGVLLSLGLWGFTLLWLFLAVATIYHSKHFPFNMGWWGFTFPIGTFALASNTLGEDIPSRFFRVIGSITSVCVFLLWLLVSLATLRDLITGGKKLFNTRPQPSVEKRQPDKVNGLGDKIA